MPVFVARQPILDSRQGLFGYELLARSGTENLFRGHDGNNASLSVIGNSICHIGLERLTGGKPVFVNFTRDLLLDGYPTLLPPDRLIVEILEAVQSEPLVIKACRELKSLGYRLALDDVQTVQMCQPFADLIDIIKVDFPGTDHRMRRILAETYRPHGITLLAEKVETHEEFEEARDLGYSLYQGYFFARPKVLSSNPAPSRRTTDYLLMKEAFRSDFSLERIELIIKQEPSSCLKLLRYVNSAFWGFSQRVRSIQHALVMLGEENIRRWVVVMVVSGFSDRKPALLAQAVVRARFCENLAPLFRLADKAGEMFLMGLFSLLDAILDQSAEEILSTVSVSPEVEAVLKGEPSPLTGPFDLARAYENGHWSWLEKIAATHRIGEAELPGLFEEAAQWANNLIEISTGEPAPAVG